MSRFRTVAGAVPALFLVLVAEAFADAAAEKYVDDALPLMYHTCQSVVDEAAGDDVYIDKVVRSLVAMSLYNRDTNASNFAISEEAKTALHNRFVSALEKGCARDKNALLAGVIDQAVAQALSQKPPKTSSR